MAKPKYAFLRQLPDYFIRKLEDGNLSVTVPGGNMSVTVPAENRFPSADAHGKDIPKHSNIRLGAPDDELTVIVEDSETGNFKSETRTAREISAAWERNQREYAEQKGPKTYLNGVSRAMVHESCIEMQDGTGRKLMQVSVSDPESAPQPVRENGRIVPGKFRSTGYGSFLVSPDSVAPSAVNPDKVNIYLGRENDVIKGYQIFTGEFDENGRGIYEKVGRTAGEIRSNYEADIEAFKAKTAETAKKKPGYPERDVGDTKFLRNVSMDCIEEIGAGQARVKISDDWYAFLDMSDCTPSIDAEGARLVPQRYDIPLPAESVRIERRDPNGSVVRWNAHPNTAIAQCEGFRRKRAEEARRVLGPGGEVWMRGVPAERVK